jgi:hypothetical protein
MKHLFRPAILTLAGLLTFGGATVVFAQAGSPSPVEPVQLSASDDDDLARKEDVPGDLLVAPEDLEPDDDTDDDVIDVDTQDDTADTNLDVDSDDSVDAAVAQDETFDTQDDSIDTNVDVDSSDSIDDDSMDTSDAAPVAPVPQPAGDDDSIDDDSMDDVESVDDESIDDDDSVDSDD